MKSMCYNRYDSKRKDVGSIFTVTVEKMFCKHCGNQIPENGMFCTCCGAKADTEIDQATATPATETTATETPVAETEVLETQPTFAQPNFETPAPTKKRKSPLVWLIPVVAVVVAAAILIAVCMGPLQGWWLKSFGEEVDYRQYVHENSTSTTSVISEAYDGVLTTLSNTTQEKTAAADFTVKLNLGDKAIGLLESLAKENLGQKMDMDWAKSIELKLSANPTDDLQQIGAALSISNQEIAVLDCILNTDKGKLFVAVTNLSKEYLEADIGSYLPEVDDSSVALMEMLQDPKLIAALPTEKELNNLLDKYITIIIDSFDDVEKTTETVEAGSLKQQLTVLTTVIEYEDILNASEDVLKTLSTDKQVEKIIRNALDYLKTQKDFDYIDADKAYNTFQDSIKDALEELKSAKNDMDDMGKGIALSEYISNAHKVVGYTLTVDGEEYLHCVELQDGDAIAYELSIPNVMEVVGNGTKKNDAITADYSISANQKEIATISLVDFKSTDNALSGKILLAPSANLLKEIGLSPAISSAINLADPKLELSFADAKGSSVECNLLSGTELLVGIGFTGTQKDVTPVTEPTNTCDIEDVMVWLEGLDTDKLLNSLKDAGLPVNALLG